MMFTYKLLLFTNTEQRATGFYTKSSALANYISNDVSIPYQTKKSYHSHWLFIVVSCKTYSMNLPSAS